MAALLRLSGDGAVTAQVASALREAVHAGRWRAGSRAPSTRALATELGVSRGVVVAAFQELVAEGYFDARKGSGTYVAETPRSRTGERTQAATREPLWRLSAFGAAAAKAKAHRSYVDDSADVAVDFQYWRAARDPRSESEWLALARARLRSGGADDLEPLGVVALREAIARHIAGARGVVTDPRNIIIVGGAQQGLDLLIRLMVGPGDEAVVEDPQFQGVRQSISAAGGVVRPAKVDRDGARWESAACDGARLIHVTPSRQFPTGANLPYRRRVELLKWARERGALVIEDDYDSEYTQDGDASLALAALDPNAVAYVGTFARSIRPSLRLGYVIAPPRLTEALASAKMLADRGEPVFEQLVLADFIAEGCYDRHVRRTSKLYAEKRTLLARSLMEAFGDKITVWGARSGGHLFIQFRRLKAEDGASLAAAARMRGVGVYTGDRYHIGRPACASLLLGFTTTAEDQIVDGVTRLRAAYDQTTRRRSRA